jgi:ATP-dependent RNA helicase RhlE
MKFKSFGLHPAIVQALDNIGYQEPTDIQLKTIPTILKGQDVLASAQTGTGKTASFALPLLHQLATQSPATAHHVKSLILAPTRELALQIYENIQEYGQFLNVRTLVVYGGVKIGPQLNKLQHGAEILIATPGRLLDIMGQKAVRFEQLQHLVLDEADRMLDMGFIHDMRRIIKCLPRLRQTLMFSATFAPAIRQLSQQFLNQPIEIAASRSNQTAVTVQQIMHPVDKAKKTMLLSHLIRQRQWPHALIFSKTKHGADKLVRKLAEDGIMAMAIHGDKTQAQRVKALSAFKEAKIRYLIATDIAARGIDIDSLPLVVNYDLPQVAEDYVHRIGRTGRAGKNGHAISLVSADEFTILHQIEKLTKKQIPREDIEGFEATHIVPSSQNPNALKRKVMARQPTRDQKNKKTGFKRRG